MRRQQRGKDAPHWRIILEARWRDRLADVTELSLAYHVAAAGTPSPGVPLPGTPGDATDKRTRRLLDAAVAARRRLADTEEALRRLATGDFGDCEQCGAPIPGPLLAAAPETRYCPACASGAPPARELVPAPRAAIQPA